MNYDTNNILKSEIRAYFGNGTQLQEMYITPALLTPENWDALAEAAKWSRANADTLVDTHWVGGSPADAAGLWLGFVVAQKGHFDIAQSLRRGRRNQN